MISPMAKMIAKAMQKYGAVVRDKSGSVALYGENPTPLINAGQPNPYPTIFGGKPSYQVMNGFPLRSDPPPPSLSANSASISSL